MPKSFPPTMRRQVCARLRAGEPVAEIAAETGISPATLFRSGQAGEFWDLGVNERDTCERNPFDPPQL